MDYFTRAFSVSVWLCVFVWRVDARILSDSCSLSNWREYDCICSFSFAKRNQPGGPVAVNGIKYGYKCDWLKEWLYFTDVILNVTKVRWCIFNIIITVGSEKKNLKSIPFNLRRKSDRFVCVYLPRCCWIQRWTKPNCEHELVELCALVLNILTQSLAGVFFLQ